MRDHSKVYVPDERDPLVLVWDMHVAAFAAIKRPRGKRQLADGLTFFDTRDEIRAGRARGLTRPR